jgi:hypothetical protein
MSAIINPAKVYNDVYCTDLQWVTVGNYDLPLTK